MTSGRIYSLCYISIYPLQIFSLVWKYNGYFHWVLLPFRAATKTFGRHSHHVVHKLTHMSCFFYTRTLFQPYNTRVKSIKDVK